ncbi:CTD nuclear envelope phosphatase 1, partial [Cichlidogyrus casuarinus]
VSEWYDLVVYTASLEVYGAGIADYLDNGRHILQRRYYRQHCELSNGLTKNLSLVSGDLSSVFILDNSPNAYRNFPDNAIPIKSWFSDAHDTALLCLLPFLDALRFVSDVRSVLSRNLHRAGFRGYLPANQLMSSSASSQTLNLDAYRRGFSNRRNSLSY